MKIKNRSYENKKDCNAGNEKEKHQCLHCHFKGRCIEMFEKKFFQYIAYYSKGKNCADSNHRPDYESHRK
jgi:hypothetical protein